MNRKIHSQRSSIQIAYPIMSPWILQGLDGSFVENIIMAWSVIVVISKNLRSAWLPHPTKSRSEKDTEELTGIAT